MSACRDCVTHGTERVKCFIVPNIFSVSYTLYFDRLPCWNSKLVCCLLLSHFGFLCPKSLWLVAILWIGMTSCKAIFSMKYLKEYSFICSFLFRSTCYLRNNSFRLWKPFQKSADGFLYIWSLGLYLNMLLYTDGNNHTGLKFSDLVLLFWLACLVCAIFTAVPCNGLLDGGSPLATATSWSRACT